MSKTFITCKILNRKWYIVQILLILIKYMKALATKKILHPGTGRGHPAFMFPYKELFYKGNYLHYRYNIEHK